MSIGSYYETFIQSLEFCGLNYIFIFKVIKRFCGSGFDDKIRHIKNSSLDYRAGRITWHAKEAMYLITNAFNERVLQPTKAPFIQLHQQQPIHYSILGSTILSYGKQTLSEIESVEELIYYLHEVQSITVRQSIFIITEYPYLKQKFAQLVSCQGKQSHSLFDITPAEFITDRNISIPENIFYLNSTLNSDEHGLYSQCGHVNRTSMLVPRSSTMDFSYTNEMCFDEHFYILQFCKYKSLVYDIQLEQGNSTNFSHFINIPGTNNSTTKIERCKSSGSCVINNFDATCKTEQELECPSSSQSSSDCTVSGWLHGHDNHSIRHTETEYESTFQNLITFSQTTTPCVHRNQTNNLVSTSSTNVIRSDLNENPNCTSREMENKTVTETKNGPSFGSCLFMYLCKLILYYILISILILCVLYINITVIYPKLCHLKVKITGCNFNRHYFFIFFVTHFLFFIKIIMIISTNLGHIRVVMCLSYETPHLFYCGTVKLTIFI